MDKKGWLGILFCGVGCLIIVGLFLGIIGYTVMYALTTGSETIIIKDKWVKYSGQDAKYLISSENEQVFQITDTLLKWRFDGSNLYSKLEKGQTCKVETQGWRFGMFSDYKNILTANCN